MNPLLPFTPLSSNVEQLVRELADLESRLRDTSGLDTTPEDILVGGEVAGCADAVNRVEVVDGRVVELELAGTGDGLLDGGVTPEGADGLCDVAGEDVGFDSVGHGEDGGSAGVVLGLEGEVERGEGVEDGTAEVLGGEDASRDEGTHRMDWTVLLKMISLYESFSWSV